MARSPYEVLGVAKTATDDEIKKAYRKLARANHPDANQGDAAAEERFKEIQGAYDMLSDAEKRKQYDTFGANRPRGGGGPGAGGFCYENVDLSDLLGQFGGIFGRGGTAGGGPNRSAAPTSSRASASRSRMRSPALRSGCRSRSTRLSHVPRDRRRAGHVSGHVPTMRRLRARCPTPTVSSRCRSRARGAEETASSSRSRARPAGAPAASA